MKGTVHSITARKMIFEFKDKEQNERFISLYSDLFVPYAEETIRSKRALDKKHPGFRVGREYEKGYYWDANGLFYVKMEPETLKEILKANKVRKERVRSNKFKYVFEG